VKVKNCWEVIKCGRGPDSGKEDVEICPAAHSNDFNGVNSGNFGGRFCWVFAGTFCEGEIQGSIAKKMNNCLDCAFYKLVNEEEGDNFISSLEEAKSKIFL